MAAGRRARLLLALLLVAAAVKIVVAEPLPEGPTVLVLTRTHGVHASDLPVIVLVLVAVWVGIARRP